MRSLVWGLVMMLSAAFCAAETAAVPVAPAPRDEPSISALSAMVVDQQTGEPLFVKNPDMASPIASITKLMTAMVVLDADLKLDEKIRITKADIDRLRGSGSRLAIGAQFTRGQLLNLALVASDNRAAAALGREYPGGKEAFVEAMNRKAAAIGMANSRFVESTGLSKQNRSTAGDLVKLVNHAYRMYPLIREISTQRVCQVTSEGIRTVKVAKGKTKRGKMRYAKVRQRGPFTLAFRNTNALVRGGEWDIGLSKTGYIREAGHCLVMQASISGERVIIVLLDTFNQWTRISDAQKIRRWLEDGGGRLLVARGRGGDA